MKLSSRNHLNLTSFRSLRRALCSTNHINILIYLILTILFVCEVGIYYAATYSWHQLQCNWKSDCTRILLVADPQIIGIQNEPSKLFTPFTIWDSDRYLSKTFSYSFQFTKPDVIVFLGDLLDEGSTATNPEFKAYVRRLFNIFMRKPFDSVPHIWIPGDNDIGGEGSDDITPLKIRRFEHAFAQPDLISIKNIKFYKINRLTSTIPKFIQKNSFSNLNSITVGLSHVPLLMSPAIFVDKVLEKLQPHVIFTGHAHKSMIISTQQEFRNDRLITPVRSDMNKVYEYYLGVNDLYEILVPPCSYRMGTDKIGYGFAVIENGNIRYTVLWSPSRLPQLYFYGFVFSICIIYLVCRYCCCRCRRRINNMKTYSGLRHVA